MRKTSAKKSGRNFDEAFRRWEGRPGQTSPEEAGRLISARVGPRHQSRRPGWPLVLVAAVTGMVALGLWLIPENGGLPPAAVAPDNRTTVFHQPPLDENTVLWWLDPHTPVYFVLTPPGSSQAKEL